MDFDPKPSFHWISPVTFLSPLKFGKNPGFLFYWSYKFNSSSCYCGACGKVLLWFRIACWRLWAKLWVRCGKPFRVFHGLSMILSTAWSLAILAGMNFSTNPQQDNFFELYLNWICIRKGDNLSGIIFSSSTNQISPGRRLSPWVILYYHCA